MKEISRQPIIQADVWVLLAGFSQVYSESCEQKAEWKNLKNVQFGQKGGSQKLWQKKCVVVKEIRAIKKKPSTLH
jgi:hypothetical protein